MGMRNVASLACWVARFLVVLLVPCAVCMQWVSSLARARVLIVAPSTPWGKHSRANARHRGRGRRPPPRQRKLSTTRVSIFPDAFTCFLMYLCALWQCLVQLRLCLAWFSDRPECPKTYPQCTLWLRFRTYFLF